MAESDVILLDSSIRRDLLPAANEPVRTTRIFAVVLAFSAFIAVSLAIHFLTPLSWNLAIARALQASAIPGVEKFMRFVSGFGNAPKLVAITVLALLACSKRAEAFWLTFCGLGGWLFAMVLKMLFASARPTDDVVRVAHYWENGSFPSGHLVFYTCFFGFIFCIAREEMVRGSFLRRGVLSVAVLLIAFVGLSRVYLGEHWVSDLPGSYVLGAFWLFVSLRLYRRWQQANRRPNDWFLPYRISGE